MRLQDSQELLHRPQSFSQDTTTKHLEPTSFLNCQDIHIAIHSIMANQNHIGQTSVHSDGLSDHMASSRSSTIQPHTTVYPELESPPYTVTTFDQQHQINETHLLTPVSGIGSPCFEQSANLSQYPSAMTPMQPQASPCGSSRMPWHNSVNMSAAQSQVGSPMPLHPPTSESHFEMSYTPAEQDDMPKPPINYYWGSYSVSPPSEPDQGSMSPQMYMSPNTHHVIQPQPMMGQMPPELPMPQHAPPSVHTPYYPQQNHNPWVEQPDITDFKTTAARRRQFGYSLPSTHIARQEPIVQASGSSKPSRPQPVGRVPRQARVRDRATPPSTDSTAAVDIARAQLGEPIPDLPDDFVIKKDCDPRSRFLYQRQRDFIVTGRKGKGMWNTIMTEFNEKFQDERKIPCLQMQVKRGRYRDQEMSPRDAKQEHIAFKAFGFVSKYFYRMVARKFKELGGGRVTPWGETALECFAVDKGLVAESLTPMTSNSQSGPPVKTRRLKKISSRLQSGAYSNAILQEAENNGGGVLEQNPQLYEQVMDEIVNYRGEEAVRMEENEDEDKDEAMLGNDHQTLSKGKSRQRAVNLEDSQGADDTPGKVASTRKAAKPRRAPAKPRAKGRLAPKPRAS
ncbi:uncharacterized protein LY79DRAFT_510600 [Colletotrichum navitas]|uniref:Uncharacterized protein n=1 Tax=Colletotrichum navitas TaxID=681940 RepID=A0AAD8Q5W7_9PEZI|nr:uncharacterized protein LY79DRAFT_510600 [Colletotrichum navitas]KAK1595828.1 hypothetical protein LY79DRAFT_510600 [Colletotrichum navitas]